jgi:hypothetical protein
VPRFRPHGFSKDIDVLPLTTSGRIFYLTNEGVRARGIAANAYFISATADNTGEVLNGPDQQEEVT